MTARLDTLQIDRRGAYMVIRRGRKSLALLTVLDARELARDLDAMADDIAPRSGFDHAYAADGHGTCRLCDPAGWPEHGAVH